MCGGCTCLNSAISGGFRILHDAETAYLTAAYRVLPALTRRWAEKISTVLHRSEPAEIIDLCSGSGGALPQIIKDLFKWDYDVSAKLTRGTACRQTRAAPFSTSFATSSRRPRRKLEKRRHRTRPSPFLEINLSRVAPETPSACGYLSLGLSSAGRSPSAY
jgi:hypothetical protein